MKTTHWTALEGKELEADMKVAGGEMGKSIADMAKSVGTGALKAIKKPAPKKAPPPPPVAKRARTPVKSQSAASQTIGNTASAPPGPVYAEKECPPKQTLSKNGDLCIDGNGFPTEDVPRVKQPKAPPPKK